MNNYPAPTIKIRLCVSLYEMLILIGVWALGYLVPSLILGVAFDFRVPSWLAFGHVYLLFGVYFVWYWKKTGQTLAMQTWRVKLVNLDGSLITRNQGLIRFALSSLWLMPTVIVYGLYQVIFQQSMGHWPTIELMFFMALFFWPLTCLLDKGRGLAQDQDQDQNLSYGRQSLVDRITKTQLLQLPKNTPD